MREHNTQYLENLNVWAGILHNRLISLFLVYRNLNTANYEDMLRNQIVLTIRRIAGENFEHVWFQQYGAHFEQNVRAYLGTIFPD
ncbi:hypothetical protein ALC56_09626 [Trachymyrmex septentrionalis]|uniref:Uncharacterized protein n=1 Tax=Trachymyrmex septentrionalis TaxID=34720 RepID=A0A151JUH6_9HYME|nr:hypothetical protein ALC56_09626 [Trachymyrmex septentrionalis]